MKLLINKRSTELRAGDQITIRGTGVILFDRKGRIMRPAHLPAICSSELMFMVVGPRTISSRDVAHDLANLIANCSGFQGVRAVREEPGLWLYRITK